MEIDEYDSALHFTNGLAPVRKDGAWGYIDVTGQVIIPLKFDKVDSSADGLAAMCSSVKWGIFRTTGLKETAGTRVPENQNAAPVESVTAINGKTVNLTGCDIGGDYCLS